jgi:hypothetical protein
MSLLHNRRNVYEPSIELDKGDLICLVFNIYMRAKGGLYTQSLSQKGFVRSHDILATWVVVVCC